MAERILCFDPGETTGWALLVGDKLVEWGQFPLWEGVPRLMRRRRIDYVVVEQFRLYRDKARAMIGSTFLPVQVIGVIRYLAEQKGIPLHFQGAGLIHVRASTLAPPYRRRLRAAGCHGSHARDAAAHGWWFRAHTLPKL